MAAGLCSLLLDLGLEPTYVGLASQTLGGVAAFADALAADGHTLPAGCSVATDPSLHALRSLFAGAELDGVFGSATTLNLLTTLPRETWAVRTPSGASSQGPFMVEVGFPSRDHHPLLPEPLFGFTGVVVMAQRILDASRLWDGGRRMSWQG